MKYPLLFLLVVTSLLSCKKVAKIDDVKYEITLISATKWHGAYMNENAEVVGVDNAITGWSYSFKNTKNLKAATLQAYPNGTNNNADCILKIYVNGTVVVSGKSSISPQVIYEFP
ncbi:MAG: hypothetical protein K2X48_04840 [Chitinophagaceae bacterium]|nr:hypothetical protein [Chitinophagaceae bacterium]